MLKVSREKDRIVVSMFQVKKLNTVFAEIISEQLGNIVSVPHRNVVFNLDGVRFIDTAGFDALLNAANLAKQAETEFSLCNVTPEVQELIDLINLNNILRVCNCQDVREKILLELDD